MSTTAKEFFAHYLRRIMSNDLVRKTAQVLHVNQVGKSVYFALFAPNGKTVSHTINNITAQFYVKSYTDLIYLTETAIGVGDERHVITILLEHIKLGDVVFDVGAFLGLLAVFFAKKTGRHGKVVAFEPSNRSYQALEDNLKLNGVQNTVALNMALGDQVKEATLQGNDSSMYSLSEQFGTPAFYQKTTIVPGDMVIAKKQLPMPNVVKIDVEGYEYSVIKGMENALKSSACRLVCCEIHPTLLPKGVSAQMVLDLLASFGFTKIETYGRGSTFHAFCYK